MFIKATFSGHVGHLQAKVNVKHLNAVYVAVCGYCDLILPIHYIIKLCVKILVKNLVKVSGDVLVYTPGVIIIMFLKG